jgi:hypothetical protein
MLLWVGVSAGRDAANWPVSSLNLCTEKSRSRRLVLQPEILGQLGQIAGFSPPKFVS